MEYYKGDIVEIITSQYKSYSDVPAHEIWYFNNQEKDVPFIGQRFKIEYINNTTIASYRTNNQGIKDFNLYTHTDRVMLYKRPLRNWIKYYLSKIKIK